MDDDTYGRTARFFKSKQHVSHLKRRNRFRPEFDYGGVLPNSGPLHKLFRTDVTTFSPDGDKDIIMGTVDFSVLMFDDFNRDEISETTKDMSQTTGLPGGDGSWIDPKGAGSTGRYYWFGEHHGVGTSLRLHHQLYLRSYYYIIPALPPRLSARSVCSSGRRIGWRA